MKEKECIIGIDIGGTNFRIGAVTTDGELHNFRKVRVTSVFYTKDPLEDLRVFLTEDYFPSLGDLKAAALSIGFPGTVDKEKKIVLQVPNVSFMENIPVVDGLTKSLGIPVLIDRDVCMALNFDRNKYKIPDCDMLAAIYFGTGIGNVIQAYGHVVSGKNGTSGELSHIPLYGSEVPCGCGNVGCMEPVAGGRYLAHLCETVFTDTDISDIFVKHKEETVVKQFIERMAAVVATELNILDPDYLLIGGGVVNMKDFPKKYFMENIHRYARKPYPEQSIEDVIVFTEDEKEKCVMGAAYHALQYL